MKLLTKSGVYKAANVTFNPETISARSYDWWEFVRVIEGRVIFNAHRYSVTTAKHQYKVRALMVELGIRIDFEVDTRQSLSILHTLADLEESCISQLNENCFIETVRRDRVNEKAKQRRHNAKVARANAMILKFGPKIVDDAREIVEAFNKAN